MDDYDREWKGYQRQFVLLETEVTQAGLAAARGAVDQAELARLQGERDAAEQSVASNQAQIDELQGQLGRGRGRALPGRPGLDVHQGGV